MHVDRLYAWGSLVIMFKSCGIIAILEIRFFSSTRTERVNVP